MVNASAATALSRAFGRPFAARFPIRQIRMVDDFGGDDERFMLADDMSAFNRRLVPGTNVKDCMHFSANGLWEGSLAKVADKEGAAK